MIWGLKDAEEIRKSVTVELQRKIQRAYEGLYREIAEKAKRLSGEGRVSEAEIILFEKEIEQRVKSINEEIKLGIVSSMSRASNAVVDDTREQLLNQGFKYQDVSSAFVYVPDDIVRSIISGQVYGNGWTLSKSIWGHNKDFNDKLSELIGKGVATGKSSQDVAKDLEQFVNPKLRTSSRHIKFREYLRDENGNFVLDENGNRIPTGKIEDFYFGNIDYNAQRLARTLISHAYQQSFERMYRKNPFVTSYVWHSSGQHGRTCEICLERDGKHFEKDKLPLDHPNGMCWFEAYSPYTSDEISDMMVKWYNSPSGTYPEIDEFINDFR